MMRHHETEYATSGHADHLQEVPRDVVAPRTAAAEMPTLWQEGVRHEGGPAMTLRDVYTFALTLAAILGWLVVVEMLG